MFKRLLEEYLKNRLNAIDKEITDLSDIVAEKDAAVAKKGKVAELTNELDVDTGLRLKSLMNRITIYSIVFGGIK